MTGTDTTMNFLRETVINPYALVTVSLAIFQTHTISSLQAAIGLPYSAYFFANFTLNTYHNAPVMHTEE